MKHNLSVTIILILVFIITQLLGLMLMKENINSIEIIDGETIINHSDTVVGETPEMSGRGAFLYVVISILVGTILILLIMKYNKQGLWKLWFFIAVFISISIALGVVFPVIVAYVLAALLTYLKMYRKNVITHNVTEILMYSGIAVLLAPMFDLLWGFILLLVIALYDMYAVWKSKHMIKMAQFQTKNNLFAGLMVPYNTKTSKICQKPLELKTGKTGKNKSRFRNAILGGGDVAFPLIFAGIVMNHLIKKGFTPEIALLQSLIVAAFATIAVGGLFILAKKDKFYPAMPFITAGCALGYLVVWII